jgi:peptide-methionine (R)-S-oxide reductase
MNNMTPRRAERSSTAQTPHQWSRRRVLTASLASLGMLMTSGPLGLWMSQTAHGELVGSLDVDERLWRQWLSEEAFNVLRREATERAFTSPLDKEMRAGLYVCAGCFLPLFSSEHKYNSGTGWPSFWQPINDAHIGTKTDFKLIWPRTEYHCQRCKGHQGHVFNDGPKPTGQRWCNNGLALRFVPDGDPLPALRQAS